MAIYGNAFSALTGGTAGALDALDVYLANDGVGIQDGDIAMVCDGSNLYMYRADEDSGLAEDVPNVIAPDFINGSAYAGALRWILQKVPQTNTIPVGTIVPWSGVYFSDSSNGYPVDILGNDIASINARLNLDGWYVCDGSELNVAGSAKYNGTGRYLPNLTGLRFIVGDFSAGNVGGNNIANHTHQVNIEGFASGGRTLSINHLPPHTHDVVNAMISTVDQWEGSKNSYNWDGTGIATSSTGGGISHNHWVDPPETTSGNPSDANNMPAYLSFVYVEKVI